MVWVVAFPFPRFFFRFQPLLYPEVIPHLAPEALDGMEEDPACDFGGWSLFRGAKCFFQGGYSHDFSSPFEVL